MIDENLSRNILVAAEALSVGTDGHNTEAGVGRSWKVAEVYPGATTVAYQPQGNKAPTGRCDGLNVPGKPLNGTTLSHSCVTCSEPGKSQ